MDAVFHVRYRGQERVLREVVRFRIFLLRTFFIENTPKMKSVQIIASLLCGAAVNASIEQCAPPQQFQHILNPQTPPQCLPNTSDTQSSTWSHKPFCIAQSSKRYCIHTTANFRVPRAGLSIISTAPAADAIADAFAHTAAARHVSEGYFSVAAIKGKGFGLVATQLIPRATTIMLDAPRIIASAEFPQHLSRTQGSRLFDRALGQLPAADRELVLGLDKSLGGSDIEDIMKTNAFACQFHDGGEDEAYMCLFPNVARINHACRPNAHARFVPKTLLMEIKALRDIAPGEEIGISYGRVDLKQKERKKLYKQGWNFECTCDMCTASQYDIAGSDQRRARFAQLRKKLENLTPATYDAQQIVAWEKEVMEVSAKEGLDVLLAADYERLAYVYAGHGMAKDAMTWAQKAKESLLEWTIVDGGPDNQVRRIEDLIAELKV
jgi:hypothetical protein